MSVPLLFLLTAVVGLGSKAFSKLCSNMLTQNSVSKYSLVLMINSLVACFFFGLFSGFSISVNTTTLIYSLIYAVIAATSVIFGFVVYRYTSISNVNIVSSSCTMICTAIIGWVFFFEDVNTLNIIRIIIMLFAIVLVFLDQRKRDIVDNSTISQKRNIIPLILIIAVITACGCANTVVLKSFAMSEAVTDENSFFFFTNVILLFASLIAFAISCLRKKGEFRSSVKLLRPKKLISIAGNTFCANISSFVSVLIVAQLDVSIYSPISSALGIIVGLVGSLIFREKLGVFAYVAAAVAGLAVII